MSIGPRRSRRQASINPIIPVRKGACSRVPDRESGQGFGGSGLSGGSATGRPGATSEGRERDERPKGGRDGQEEGRAGIDVHFACRDPPDTSRRPEDEDDLLAVEVRGALPGEGGLLSAVKSVVLIAASRAAGPRCTHAPFAATS